MSSGVHDSSPLPELDAARAARDKSANDAAPVGFVRFVRGARRHWPDILAVLLLTALVVKRLWGIERVEDIALDDETHYLYSGRSLGELGLPRPEWNPLYAVWYWVLSRVASDPVTLFYLNVSLLSLLIPLGVYALVRACGGRPLAGLLAASFLVLANLARIYPYPSHLATVLLLGGSVFAARARRLTTSLALLSNALLVTAYVRPEFFLPFLAVGGASASWMAIMLVRKKTERRRFAVAALAIVLPCAVLVPLIGNPLHAERAFFAFGQHYSINLVKAKGLAMDPWTNWVELVRADFGDARTVSQAFLANPGAFTWHVGTNARALPAAVGSIVEPRADLPPAARLVATALLVATAIAGAIGVSLRLARKRREEEEQDRRALVLMVFTFAVILLSSLVSALLVFPRFHYLVVPVSFGLAILAAGLHTPSLLPALPRLTKVARGLAWTLAAVAVAIVPTLGARAEEAKERGEPVPYLQTALTVSFIRGLDIRDPVVILESEFSRAYLAGLRFTRIAQWEKSEGFASFVAHRGINFVVMNQRLRDDTRFRDDPEFRAFASPDRDPPGFVVLPVPGTDIRIAVKSELLGR